jgi:hypothetical protein
MGDPGGRGRDTNRGRNGVGRRRGWIINLEGDVERWI